MSIRVMTLVWDRFDAGGGELLLALALADFADDSGRSIWPSVQTLMRKTRQSRRTVQRQLAELRARGWLIAAESAPDSDRAGLSVLYHIDPNWIRGGVILTPPQSQTGAVHDAGGCATHGAGGAPPLAQGDAPCVAPNPSSYPSLNHQSEPSETLALSGEPTKARKGRTPRAAVPLPDDFDLTAARRSVAEQQRLDAEPIFAMFCAHARAKGRTLRDWDAGWRFWCLTERKYQQAGPAKGRSTRTSAQTEDDELRVLRDRRRGMTRGMANFRDPYRGESADNYRRAMDTEFERRAPPPEPRFQQNAQKVGQLVQQLARSKRTQP